MYTYMYVFVHVYLLLKVIAKFQINIYTAEKTLNNLQWKRISEMVEVGILKDTDDFFTVKLKCADALGIGDVHGDLVLVHGGGARVDSSAFSNLGHFMMSFSAQQRAKFALGIACEVIKMLNLCGIHYTIYIIYRCMYMCACIFMYFVQDVYMEQKNCSAYNNINISLQRN